MHSLPSQASAVCLYYQTEYKSCLTSSPSTMEDLIRLALNT